MVIDFFRLQAAPKAMINLKKNLALGVCFVLDFLGSLKKSFS
jgi:hypothetical protein